MCTCCGWKQLLPTTFAKLVDGPWYYKKNVETPKGLDFNYQHRVHKNLRVVMIMCSRKSILIWLTQCNKREIKFTEATFAI